MGLLSGSMGHLAGNMGHLPRTKYHLPRTMFTNPEPNDTFTAPCDTFLAPWDTFLAFPAGRLQISKNSQKWLAQQLRLPPPPISKIYCKKCKACHKQHQSCLRKKPILLQKPSCWKKSILLGMGWSSSAAQQPSSSAA